MLPMLPKETIIMQLIDVYKDMPFLWDKKHRYYRNQICRNEGYRALLEIYKKLDKDATVKVVSKKLQNLRTNYIKELKKVMKSHQTEDGARPEAAYVPTLWYFKKLKFLNKSLQNENGELRDISAVDPLNTEDASSPSQSDAETDHPEDLPKYSISLQNKIITKDVSSSSLLNAESYRPEATEPTSLKKRRIKKDVSPSSPSDAESDHSIPKHSRTSSVPSHENRRRKKKSSLHRQHDNSMTNTSGKEPRMPDRECEILGRSIGLQLRDLSKKQRTITQKLISDAIFYGNMGLLSENSFVGLKQPNTQTLPQPSPSSSTHLNKGKDHNISLPHKLSPQSASSSPSYIVINAGTPSPPPAEYIGILSPNRQSSHYIYSTHDHESPPLSHI